MHTHRPSFNLYGTLGFLSWGDILLIPDSACTSSTSRGAEPLCPFFVAASSLLGTTPYRMASGSGAAPTRVEEYDVFISHCGADCKSILLDHTERSFQPPADQCKHLLQLQEAEPVQSARIEDEGKPTNTSSTRSNQHGVESV